MIGSRIALFTLACLSPVMAAGDLSQNLLYVGLRVLDGPQEACYNLAVAVVDAKADEAQKTAKTAFSKHREEKDNKTACDAAAKIVETAIAGYKKAVAAVPGQTEDAEGVTRENKIKDVLKGGSSSMLLIIIIIAAVLIVGGVLVYCFCCRSSSSASDDDL